MIQTGMRSTGWRAQASSNRVGEGVMNLLSRRRTPRRGLHYLSFRRAPHEGVGPARDV
jgi:hypothetical protein